MEIDDSNFSLVRKNLNIISVLILVLAYTNAKLNTISFLGLQISLNAHKLYIAIFILYLYFLWRFLTKVPLKSGFWNDFVQYYLVSDEGVKKEHNFDRYRKDILLKFPKLAGALKDPQTFLTTVNVIRFPGKALTDLRLQLIFQTNKDYGEQGSHNIFADQDFNVSRWFVLKKLIIFCFKYDKFGDYLFPLIPVIVNINFFIFMTEWQGSFSNIIHDN